ncbi:DUF1028 domain-containing protein [Rhodobacteraceae bacterium F11138]|nr:DUF1028 domain-containing protein [Rhodobacteraceae bacterium F11138]
MTFSILARDPKSDAIGGAAATGSLCVGGWVLRGDPRAGMSASQGAAPSTFWGDDVLAALQGGESAADAIGAVTGADAGRDQRQVSALGLRGPGAAFTGKENTPAAGSILMENGVVAGNMLTNVGVLNEMAARFETASGTFSQRLIASLFAAQDAGGDMRGLQSAALLIVSPEHAPITLRVDYHETPLAALVALYDRALSGDYADWSRRVPCLSDPQRTLD